MKFWAKAKIEEESAKKLILAFFNEFNPENSIEIKGKQARIEIVYEELPLKIIEAITNCEEHEIIYEKPEVLKEIPKRASKTTKQKISAEDEIEEIPEITEIARRSNSYEDFIRSITKWIGPDKKEHEIFLKMLLKAAIQVDVINWKNIYKVFNNQGYEYRPGVKSRVSDAVTRKFKNIGKNVTILDFLKIFVKYQDFEFSKDIVKWDISKERLKMKCMPESIKFEAALGELNKTQPIHVRVEYVLNTMRLKQQNFEKQNIILASCNIAVMSKVIDINTIYEKSGIKNRAKEYVQLTISKFANDFAKSINSSAERIAAVDFLKDLQEIVLLEDEKANLTQ